VPVPVLVPPDSGGRVSELTLLILRLGFLIALWVFVFFVVYAVRSDLFGPRVRRLPTQPSGSQATSSGNAANAFLTSATPRIQVAETDLITSLATSSATEFPLRLVIVSGDKTGQDLPLTGDTITIGRSSDSSLVIKDDYTSTHHARLEVRGGSWVLRDLDSTNGTLLGGVKVTSPTPIPLNTPITIGSTSFEVRR
jgi:hypothetical protein